MTIGDMTRTGDVLYDNMGNTEEIPAEEIRRALHDFLESGGATPGELIFRAQWC